MTSSNIRFVMEEYDVEHLDRHLLWMYPFIIGREFYCPELRVTWVEISGERPALNYLFWDKRVGGLVGQSFVLPRPGLRNARLVDAEIAASEFVEPMGYLGRDAYGVLWEDGCGPIPPSRCVVNPSNFAACVFAEESIRIAESRRAQFLYWSSRKCGIVNPAPLSFGSSRTVIS